MVEEFQIITSSDGRSRYYENGILKSIDGVPVENKPDPVISKTEQKPKTIIKEKESEK